MVFSEAAGGEPLLDLRQAVALIHACNQFAQRHQQAAVEAQAHAEGAHAFALEVGVRRHLRTEASTPSRSPVSDRT